MYKLYHTLLALTIWVGCASAFTLVSSSLRRHTCTQLAGASSLEDSEGNELKVGSIIKVAVEGLKAFQVNKKGFGSFVDGEFSPNQDASERRDKHLELPVGLRGIVTKLYDVDEISSNLPIQAKFEPGKHDSEPDPPVTFLMHFSPNEVEAV